MRRLAFAALSAFVFAAGCATQQPTPPRGSVNVAAEIVSSGVWANAFDAGPGVATATLSGPRGLAVRITCQAPNGAVKITDWGFSKPNQGNAPTTIYVGSASGQSLGLITGVGDGRQALVFDIASNDRVWNSLTPSAEIRVGAGGAVNRWPAGSAQAISDLVNSCRTIGS